MKICDLVKYQPATSTQECYFGACGKGCASSANPADPHIHDLDQEIFECSSKTEIAIQPSRRTLPRTFLPRYLASRPLPPPPQTTCNKGPTPHPQTTQTGRNIDSGSQVWIAVDSGLLESIYSWFAGLSQLNCGLYPASRLWQHLTGVANEHHQTALTYSIRKVML